MGICVDLSYRLDYQQKPFICVCIYITSAQDQAVSAQQKLLTTRTYTSYEYLALMDAFEDDNPFETDDRISEETSSSLKIDISEPNTPPQSFSPLPDAHTSPPNPPTPSTKSFPGSHKPHQHTPQHPSAYKTDFCCSRDRWLHSGQDFEILVSGLRYQPFIL